MLKKNCYQVLGSQKSKLTPLELVFQTAGVINPAPPPYKDRVKRDKEIHPKNHRYIILAVQMQIYGVPQVNYSKVELL